MPKLSPAAIQNIVMLCEAYPERAATLFCLDDVEYADFTADLWRDADSDENSFVCRWDYEQRDIAADFIERCKAIREAINATQLVEA